MNLLKSVNHECRKTLIDHASKFGAKSAFTDDAFTFKKNIPGVKPRLASARWIRWLTVTHESFKLMLGHMIQKHEATHDQARAKASKQKIERASEMAALVCGIKEDVCSNHPAVHNDDLQTCFGDAFLGNDPNLLMAL